LSKKVYLPKVDAPTRCEANNMNANEVLKQYAAGKRNFRQADLRGISLIKANLREADFTGANLTNSDLSKSDLSSANLNWVNLRGAKINGANMRQTKMPDGRIHNDHLTSARYALKFCQQLQ